MMTRLAEIAIRQRRSRIRDVLFTCVIALATLAGAAAVGTAAGAPSTRKRPGRGRWGPIHGLRARPHATLTLAVVHQISAPEDPCAILGRGTV